MRDRLIELLKEYHAHPEKACPRSTYEPCDGCKYDKGGECDRDGKLADHLLAEGVIVPPCKVGDTVYYINTRPHIGLFRNKVYEAVVSRIVVNWLGVSIVIRIKTDEGVCEVPSIYDFGKIVFLTKEEAERALAERREG